MVVAQGHGALRDNGAAGVLLKVETKGASALISQCAATFSLIQRLHPLAPLEARREPLLGVYLQHCLYSGGGGRFL